MVLAVFHIFTQRINKALRVFRLVLPPGVDAQAEPFKLQLVRVKVDVDRRHEVSELEVDIDIYPERKPF